MISTNDELRLMRARFSRSASSLLSSLLALGAVACGSGGDAVGPEAEPVLDGGADDAKDGDVDPGVDAGADADTDTDADVGDADTEGDADVEADGGVDADADADDADVDDADANDADPDADVAPAPARIEVTPDAPSVVEGRTVKLVAKGYDDDDDEIDVDVTWSSSDETRATVDDTDLVTTLRPGTVTITATASGKSDAATITITESTAVSIRFEAGTADVPLDGPVQLRAIVEDAEGYELLGRDVVFESEDESIVTVTPDGIATGVEVGEATIKVKLGAIERSLDVRVVLRFAEIVASYRNTCGLTAGGRAWCWGDNTYGQLGIGTKGAQPYDAPQRVGMDPDLSFETLKLGAWFTCALSTEKEVWCWGNNVDTVLGLPFVDLLDSSTPRLVPDREYEKLSAMQWAVCGLDTEGFAHCWGSGSVRYELGANVIVDTPTPVAVSAPEGEASPVSFVELRHGDYFSCGLTGTGRLYCWGPQRRLPARRRHHHPSRALRASARRQDRQALRFGHRLRLRRHRRRHDLLLGQKRKGTGGSEHGRFERRNARRSLRGDRLRARVLRARRGSRLRARSRGPRPLLGKQCPVPTRPVHERWPCRQGRGRRWPTLHAAHVRSQPRLRPRHGRQGLLLGREPIPTARFGRSRRQAAADAGDGAVVVEPIRRQGSGAGGGTSSLASSHSSSFVTSASRDGETTSTGVTFAHGPPCLQIP